MRANRGNTANAVNATGPGSTWQHVGPNGQDDPPKSFGFGYGHESGRDISIVISPADPNTIFVGTAGGGVWKSADGGTSWTTTTDNQASLAIAPTTPYTVYALTGEGNFSGDSYYGAGLLRSTDGGASWTQTGTSLSRLSANKLAVDPTSPAILYAALTNGGRAQFPEGRGATTATGGIYRSLDSGATWALSLNPGSSADSPCAGTGVMSGADTLTYDSSEAGTDIAVGVDPATPTNATIYAALGAPGGCPNNGIYKGVDHGQTWTPLTAFTQTVPVLDQGKIGRISLSTMPGNPQVVYASASITGGNGNSTYLEGVYESTNGGATWARVTNPDPSTGAKPGTQYDYDTYIAVDPLVSSTVFVAGTDVFKSTNSGGTWANVTNAYGGGAGIVHGDQHALAFVPRTDSATTPTIFIGNDGGLYRSTNGGDTNTWSNSDSGIEARQIYHSAVSAPGQPTQYYIGLQDNNVSHYTGRGQWLPVSTGDGMNAAVALTNSDIAYIAVQNDQISVTTNGGQRFTDVSDENDIKTSPAVTDKGRTPFVTAFALDPSNPNRLLVGTYRLWETTDSGASWHTTGTGAQLTNTGGGVVDTLAIAPTMTSTVYAGTNDGLIQTSIDGGATFTRGTGLPGRAIGGIAVSPITSTTAWAGIEAFNAATPNAPGHVFQTTDGGQTWNDVTGNLPDTPVNGIATGADGRVYVATDTGVFSSPNATSASATWTPLGDSLPNAPIFDVTLNSDGTTLYASTHGRGLWSLPVSSLVSGTATGTATTGTATGTATTGTATGMGTTITVCSSGCNYTTIEDALANASDGYTISISPGVYTPTRTLDISNNITLLGQDTSTGKAADVTVDGSNNGRAPVVTVESGKSVTINGLTLTKGVAGIGGGISNNGTLTILDSTISGNTASSEGAGIYNPGGPVLVVNSTIANNVTGPSGDGGSAVMNQAQLTVINSTISGNSLTTNFPVPPSGFAGGIYSTSSTAGVAVTLTNSLIAGNTFTDNNNNAPITSESDFVDQSGNSSGSYMGTPTSGTYTDGAIGGSHMGSDADNIVGRSYNNQTYALSGILTTASGGGPALTDNGGHTQTIAPSANSPAIDHGDNNTCQAAPVSGVDQRGVTRPQPADGSCDIGAVEVGATAMGTGTATTGPTGTMATGTAMTGTATGTVTTGPTSTATTGATGTATVGTATASPSSVATGSVTAAPTGTATTGAATSGPTRTATAGTATTGPTGSATAGTATTTTGTATAGPAGSATAGTATGTATTSPIATSSVTAAPTGTTTGPSATNTNTATSSPTNTSTSTRTATATNTATGTNTATATDTNTATSTNTAVPSTNTSTNTPTATATATATSSNTPVPSTNTATMVLPTGTNTSAPPTGTNTSLPSTASATTAPTSTGVPPTLARRFCIAGGVESANVHSALAVLNPNSGMAHNAVTFYFADGTTRTASFTVPANAQRSVSVAGLAGRRGSFGLCVSSDRSISGQLNLTRPGRDGDSVLGNPALGTHWYLAEGYTGLTFHETVALLNPSAFHPATVRLRLLLPGGKGNRTVTERVGAHSERLVNINSLVSGASVSIVADADRAVLVERTLTFSAGGYGLTTRGAAPDAATSWLFAEGSTAAPFQTFLTVLNPQGGTANVTATFFGSNGQRLGRRTLTLAARNRATLRVNDIVPHRSGVASVVTSDRPVVVERPEYFGSPNNAGVAGSDVFGRTSAARQWSIPGGVLRGGDSEFLLLYNPSPRAVPVDITFYKGTNGRTVTTRVTVPAQARYTFDVTAFQRGTSSVPGLRLTASHGAVLRARNNQTFIVERSVFGANHSTLQASEGLAQ